MALQADFGGAPAVPDVVDPSGGANQTRVRAHNERLVMSLVRRHGSLSKADIARRSGLSAQTVSVIMRALEKDDLLIRGDPVRGRVGQPSIPMRLNPDAVYSYGVKIGRRSCDLILMDFVGAIRLQLHQAYAYPMPENILPFITDGIPKLAAMLTADQQARIAGVGIATPFQLWSWAGETGAPVEKMESWRGFDLRSEVAARTHHPVLMQNDATSACGAELIFGVGASYSDFIYFYIGSFIGGGIVLNSALFSGRTGTAGAVGPLQVSDRNGKPQQLLKIASIFVLENLLRERAIDPKPLWYSADEWIDFGEPLETWIQLTAGALAQAIVSSASIIDFNAAVIDGGFPPWVRERVVIATRKALEQLDLEGVIMPEIVEGAVGAQARAIGAASLPLFSRYLIDTNVLFKETA